MCADGTCLCYKALLSLKDVSVTFVYTASTQVVIVVIYLMKTNFLFFFFTSIFTEQSSVADCFVLVFVLCHYYCVVSTEVVSKRCC